MLVVIGPTASGKTALAVELAQRFNGEIVGADSRQVYRRLDLGTAKPTAEEQRLARHHLIDVVAPDEMFGLAKYLDLATSAIEGIRMRGRLPILVGGTGQYLWALVEGWDVPRIAPDLDLRGRLIERAEREGPLALHAELALHDPMAAAAIHPHNVRRVVRALELLAATGRRPSELRSRRRVGANCLILGLACERVELHARIDSRVDAMFEAGLVEEVRALLADGYDPGLPSLSGIGYAQVVRCLHGTLDLEAAKLRTKHATHRLVRQQATWFRTSDPRIAWAPAGVNERAVKLAERWLAHPGAE